MTTIPTYRQHGGVADRLGSYRFSVPTIEWDEGTLR